MYLGFGGLKLNTPDTNEQYLGSFPTGKPSIIWIKITKFFKLIVQT